ncbi:MAG: RagB/SusD family nutrient uptake outer membrane protein [Prevotella sp.]|jgi:hypothetical protein|nr:RagB/SusD family nutrient uptake outer membrane protein [Prevotella sp.]
MKKLQLYIFATAIASTLVGCSLNQEPISTPTELTEGSQTDTTTAVLKDKAAAENQLTNLYQLFRNRQEHSHLDYLLIGETHSDNAYAGTTGAEVVPYETNSIDASNSVLSRDWSRYLEDIAQANVLINGSEQLKNKGTISDSEYHLYKAQGEIFRAIQMFVMARLWGSFPVITSIAKTITSSNIDEVYPTYYPPRSSQEDCYKQIVADLTDAEQYAPDFKSSDRTLMTKTVAQALLAKVYAEKPLQDYNKVIEYADKVRATSGLALEDDFSTLWGYDSDKKDCVKRNTSEGILEAHWNAGSSNWESWMYGRCLEDYDYYFSWAKWITPSRDLINDFTKEGDTTRLKETVVYYACKWSNYYPSTHYAFMYKLRSGYNNEYKLRLADIILIEAEAYAYQGNLAKAAELVNIIRHRAKLANLTSDKTSSKDAMIEAVLHERRLELALEGERWFDLVRNGKVEEYLNGLDKRDSGRLAQKKQFDENSYLLPIPQTALDENTNLIQNPGY